MQRINSIVLVDDHAVVRSGLKGLVESMGTNKVIREFDNGKQLIDGLAEGMQPDMIIMDLTMPVMDGKSTMKWLQENNVVYPVLILTLDTNDETIIELFRLGARGYLPKSCTADMLKKAIDDIIHTGYYHNELLSHALQASSARNKKDERHDVQNQLTEREKTFLQLVCDEHEYTYEQMADILKVHRRTIDGYREALFEKFNIKSKTGLVLFAIKYGLTDIKYPA